MNRYLTIRTVDAELAAVLHYPDELSGAGVSDRGKYPVVVICHGFAGNSNGTDRLFVEAARELSAGGYYVLRFDYGGCGESTGDYGSGGMDRIIEETRRAIDYVASIDHIDPSRITLLGHSLGGAAAVLTAVRDSRIKSLILWSPVAHPLLDIVRIVGERKVQELTRGGKRFVDHLHYELKPEFFDSLGRYHPLQELAAFKGDVFIAHGTGDRDIPVDYAFLYQKMFWTRKSGVCDKEIIMNADHSFSSAAARRQVIGETVGWLRYNRQCQENWSHWTI